MVAEDPAPFDRIKINQGLVWPSCTAAENSLVYEVDFFSFSSSILHNAWPRRKTGSRVRLVWTGQLKSAGFSPENEA